MYANQPKIRPKEPEDHGLTMLRIENDDARDEGKNL